jgi:hypothetical protein
MAANTSPIFGLTAKLQEKSFTSADTTTLVSLWAAGANGGKITAINVTSDDTATINFKVAIYDGATSFLIGTVPVVTLSGTNGTAPAVNLLDSDYIPCLDIDGGIYLPTGYSVYGAPLATMTAVKTANVVAIGVDY